MPGYRSSPSQSRGQGSPLLGLVDLTRRFGDLAAVDHLSLEISEGEFFSLIGPSGCGKTTTLRMIAGLDIPTSGRLYLRGFEITREPAYKRPVNTVFQNYALFPHLNVFDNVAFGLRERSIRRQEIRERVQAMLELVELSGRGRARPSELSGGQQQRVALARALVLNPEVLLLDEPLGALDLKLRKQMQMVLKRVQREVSIAFVYVTHDQEEAFAMSDRVGVMRSGILEQVGTPVEVYRRPKTLFVADFVGASNRIVGRVLSEEHPGSYEVQLDSDRESVPTQGVPGIALDARVALILRPEATCIVPESGEAARLRGEIRDTEYLGFRLLYRVDCGEFGEFTVMGDAEDEGAHRPGGRVGISWMPDATWAIQLQPIP